MKHILIYIIEFYRRYLAVYKLPTCRFCPTCSEYAKETIKKNGPVKGALKAIWRILRCNPFARGGYDPA